MYIQPTILILDSGVGGLSIYTKISKLLPNVHYLYFFDNQAFPYGNKSAQFITKRVTSIINTINNIHHINLVIIACNTASITSLQILKNNFTFPIIGVIPSTILASKLTKNRTIGLLATYRTIHHDYTTNLKKRLLYKYKIILLNASELVHLAESKIHGEKIQISKFYNIISPWLKIKNFPDTIILGCTHLFLLKQELMQILPKNCHLIDPTNAIIDHSIRILHKNTSHIMHTHFKYNAKNKAYCSKNTKKTIKIKPILLSHYNFISLEVLSII